jgi:hypothetical protein
MLYGHVESLADRVNHLHYLRDLQDETGGFVGFIPLAYQPENNRIPVHHPPTGFDSLRTIAVSRIYLDNFDHITAYWVGLGMKFSERDTGHGQRELDLGREGGHSKRRILHAQDVTGREIERALLAAVAAQPGIVIFEDHFAIDLITTHKLGEGGPNRCLGVYVLDKKTERNRPKKHAKIKQYADDLVEGRWSVTGDTIKFGSNGLLRDGHNRLSACLRSGRPLMTHVVFGIDPEVFYRLDIGKNRNGADVFWIAGIPRPAAVASTRR